MVLLQQPVSSGEVATRAVHRHHASQLGPHGHHRHIKRKNAAKTTACLFTGGGTSATNNYAEE
jgi:hypothetical protein